MDVADMDAVMAAIETPAVAEAMEYDGVLPETLDGRSRWARWPLFVVAQRKGRTRRARSYALCLIAGTLTRSQRNVAPSAPCGIEMTTPRGVLVSHDETAGHSVKIVDHARMGRARSHTRRWTGHGSRYAPRS
jgi:hypothetical protein